MPGRNGIMFELIIKISNMLPKRSPAAKLLASEAQLPANKKRTKSPVLKSIAPEK